MALVTIKPENVGGGRSSGQPSGKLYKEGQFTLNAAFSKLLGNVERVIVQVDDKLPIIVLTPTTPTNEGGSFSVNGGGYMPIRLTLRGAVRRFPHLIGDYDQVRKRAGAIELRQSAQED